MLTATTLTRTYFCDFGEKETIDTIYRKKAVWENNERGYNYEYGLGGFSKDLQKALYWYCKAELHGYGDG